MQIEKDEIDRENQCSVQAPSLVGPLGGKLTSPEFGFTDHKWNKGLQNRPD